MNTENEALGMDFKNLMSCIHYHEDSQDNDVILETLKTITDICSNESCGRDAFREEGGLDFLVEFLFVTDNTIFLDHTLKTLAFVIDENVHSQMYMSKRSVFEVLQTILKNQTFPTSVQKNALVLISTILYHNSTAQSLVCEIGLLQDLLNMYEHYTQGFMINNSCMTSNLENRVLNLWMSTNSALCFAVNNPQNEKNQDICKNIFPVSLRILEYSSNSAVMCSAASFLALTISDYGRCQDYFSSCDGLLVLKRCFQKHFDALLMDMKICNGIIAKETYQAINNIVGIISSASLDHEKNAAISGDLGILSMMVKLLFLETLDAQLKTKIVLSLGNCIGACCNNKSYVLEIENFDAFLKKSLQLEDSELSFACKYLLQVCLSPKGSHESNLQCINEDNFDEIYPKCNAQYFNNSERDSFVLNGMGTKIPSLKQNSTKMSSTKCPTFKVKSNSRSFEKTYSASLSSRKSTSESVHRKRKGPLNKLSSIKKGLSDSTTIEYDLVSGQHFSSRDKKYSSSTYSNSKLDSSKSKSDKKEVEQPSCSDKFSKQDISRKLLFTDFLRNETKPSSTEFKNESFIKTECTKIVPDSLISDWHMYSKDKKNGIAKLPTYNSTRVESFSQDNIGNSFSPYELKPATEKSSIEKCPRLFKKKKDRLSSKNLINIASSSSSEYSFAPNSDKNSKIQENKSDSQFGFCIPYQSKLNFSEASNNFNSKRANDNQNNSKKFNVDDKRQAPLRKPFSFINTEKLVKKDQQSEFSLKLASNSFKNSFTKDSSFPSSHRRQTINKENVLDITKSAEPTPHHGKTLMDSDFSSNLVSQCNGRCNKYLGDGYQPVNWIVVPQTSRMSENAYKKKCSWSCSSTGTCQESFSPFSSSLNSSRHVQVIVLPKGTCEQHGLSKTVELLEVVSLEDIMKD